MPRERADLIRDVKFKSSSKIFILAYEGNISEPQYYEALKDTLKYKEHLVRVISLKRDPNDTKSAPNHVFQKLKKIKEEYNLKPTDEFWMIIDKDRWVLDKWVDKCTDEGNFNIALSNPCFEFWLLLHVAGLSDFSTIEQTNIKENAKVTNKKNHLDQILNGLLDAGYNKTNIMPERFLPNIENAIRQGIELDSNDIHDSLGSHNYKLVQKLIE
ncbi:MAG: RloB family protein [Reichenbachiella sp.]